MEIKVHFKTSHKIHPKFQILKIGQYTIEPLPTNSPNAINASNSYLLRFKDAPDIGKHINPKVESTLFLSCFSLFLGTRLQIESLMMNCINIPDLSQKNIYSKYETTLDELPDCELLIKKLKSKKSEIAKQFIRACEVYRTAMNLLGENNTLSYFLLTISIECLSNKVIKKVGSCDKFVNFILKYIHDKSDFKTEDDWREILKEIYYEHRSGFTHGGKDIPEAVSLADRLNRTYVRNVINGKEVRTPGLKWFESIVRQSLIGFLQSQEYDADTEQDHLKNISLEYGGVNLKARKAIKANTLVTAEDVQLD